jgi:hypothetical protein
MKILQVLATAVFAVFVTVIAAALLFALFMSPSLKFYALYPAVIAIGYSISRAPKLQTLGVATTVLALAVLAFGPGLVARHQFMAFATEAAGDFSLPASVIIRDLELPIEWAHSHPNPNAFVKPSPSKIYCGLYCQKLLFSGAVQSVSYSAGTGRSFRLEYRENCPEQRSILEKRYQTQLKVGQCLIEDVSTARPDVVLQLSSVDVTTDELKKQIDICHSNARYSLRRANGLAQRVKILERINGSLDPVEQRTNIHGYVASFPFLLAETTGECDELFGGPLVAHQGYQSKPIWYSEILSRRYGKQFAW